MNYSRRSVMLLKYFYNLIILKTKFRVIMIALLDNKKLMGEEAQEALLMIAKAQYAAGEFQYQ